MSSKLRVDCGVDGASDLSIVDIESSSEVDGEIDLNLPSNIREADHFNAQVRPGQTCIIENRLQPSSHCNHIALVLKATLVSTSKANIVGESCQEAEVHGGHVGLTSIQSQCSIRQRGDDGMGAGWAITGTLPKVGVEALATSWAGDLGTAQHCDN